MVLQQAFHSDPARWLAREQPDEPVFFFDPRRLHAAAREFIDGFPGEVTYAVKANPDPSVIEGLVAAGMQAFDVASPDEMALVRSVAPKARLHYHNPVRSRAEIAAARAFGITSWSVDRMAELDKLGPIEGVEIAVRLKLPVAGAVYDFGSKFGASPDAAEALLRAVAARGGLPSMTFHPGTQCRSGAAWAAYIRACGEIAARAGVTLHRLNVGGGFPAFREAPAPDLPALFETIRHAADEAFDGTPPALVCEPGRAMVAEAFELGLQVKARDGDAIFLNDGIYGGLSEWRDLGPSTRITALATDGTPLRGEIRATAVFGPTCDSLDRLSDRVDLPCDLAEGDFLLFQACGAYSTALVTRFNGYGVRRIVTLMR
ncbi:type III PLP-dependent enzyme [Maliponia aquimaris]|uniref:ornithine decarboxylase n=1 Tax=Maliponia aquimaris TaxID=1673631 RepID=A0A238L3P1_9RHOB|nr:type III PLP-dependent enzyme [Maliponia aquimaris]SMX49597.1 Lysine/ornithine decarboxylase [Maliponia aquimaris]